MEERDMSWTSPSEVSRERRPDGVRDWWGRLVSGLAFAAIVSCLSLFLERWKRMKCFLYPVTDERKSNHVQVESRMGVHRHGLCDGAFLHHSAFHDYIHCNIKS